ncbi:MAG TPA: isoprenylcysteine carboxylmethyltransferase family protein [Bacteroidales bacterium]|nr:isoprenylcysteine carboxylmethyltransferase family protein [Bacteroidales bacterium]
MRTGKSMPLIIRAIMMFLFSILLVGVLVFLPAGTMKFWNGWLFMAALFIPMFFVLIYLMLKDPELLARRLKTKEKEKTQKVYLVLSIIVCLSAILIPGLDHRYGWSAVPLPVAAVSTVIMMSGYLMFFIVMKQNTYASRVVEIQDEQKLIDTGLYSFVRHPMYLAATILYLFIPLVLGSFYGLIAAVFIPMLLIIRIMNEEKVLVNGLKGYDEYMKKVKYRLFPGIW